ncbi:ribonuclease HI [Haloferula luteola]|uniref:Ribonuclease H n=1 Tax=Haloferula luteola TaxID=595692 RepID=A0A840V8X3_9BACT|nr:ribonuclease HI [Haloferula luteola]MBB5350410.1 ribonuclease HI [Haloferula luteola]
MNVRDRGTTYIDIENPNRFIVFFDLSHFVHSALFPSPLPTYTAAMKDVTIHTDGACKGNPGPGGYGVVLVSGKHRLELSAGYLHTTNNRMELLAAIVALEKLNTPCRVTLLSDSRYLIDAMTKGWLSGWKARGWVTASRQPVKNPDLWKRLESAAAPHTITWKWLRGHAGHRENERCDELAVAASRAPRRLEDSGFDPQA